LALGVALVTTLPVCLGLSPRQDTSKSSPNETTEKAASTRVNDRIRGARVERGVVHVVPPFRS
jgi:hypothetical protein